jgi:hypothetical protein
LDEPASIELEHGHRYRVRPARPASAHRQENVRCTGWYSRGNQPACKRVDQAEEPSGDQLAQVGPRARSTIRCHRVAPSPSKRLFKGIPIPPQYSSLVVGLFEL